MRKYTRKQRAKIYLQAAVITFIEDSQFSGACWTISEITKECSIYDSDNCFREIKLFNPGTQDYWFHGENANKQRIIMLLLCAEMCKD